MSALVAIRHKRKDNYTIVNNRPIRDKKISFKATGLLLYLMHLPEDWRLNLRDLTNRKTDGWSAVRSGIDELVRHRYVFIERERDPSGRFTRCIWTITDEPTGDGDEEAGPPGFENPHVGNPTQEKPPLG